MTDDQAHEHGDRCERWPGDVNPTEWHDGDDIIKMTMRSMAHTEDAAVIMRVMLARYGWAMCARALDQAARDDVSGAAVTAVDRLMQPVFHPGDRRDLLDRALDVVQDFVPGETVLIDDLRSALGLSTPA